jgi:hypothetical protein
LKVRVIEDVGGVNPELQRKSFQQAEVLEYQGVNRAIAWAYKGGLVSLALKSPVAMAPTVTRCGRFGKTSVC